MPVIPCYCDLIRAYDERYLESLTEPIWPTVEILRQVKQSGCPLYALSNWPQEKFVLVRPKYEFFDWFDEMVISGAVGMAKPDPRIFQLLLERIGRPVSECLIIDDSEKNLLHLSMPRVGGMEALREIARRCHGTRVLVLTMHEDPAYLRSALAAGASGYLLKKAVDSELIAAIRAVDRGGTFVDPRLADVLVQDVLARKGPRTDPKRPVPILSDRELQVLRLVALGYTSAQIAQRIHVGVKTVETYRSRAAEKVGLRTRRDVIRFAMQMGLLTQYTPESRPDGSAQ